MATHYGTAVAERLTPGNMHCNYGDIKFNIQMEKLSILIGFLILHLKMVCIQLPAIRIDV